jgi:hypothetical protein
VSDRLGSELTRKMIREIGIERPDDDRLPKKRPWWARLFGLQPTWQLDSDGLGVPFWRVVWRRPPLPLRCTCAWDYAGPVDECPVHGRGGPEDSFT